jgi:RNA polymerase sigma-70 factor, ECF subfamily
LERLAPHTLAGVLSKLQRGERDDPELSRRLDVAFAKHESWLHHRCGDELRGFPAEAVEEVVQDVLLTAWRRLPEYRPEHRFRAWLGAIALRRCSNARRKRWDVLSEDGLFDPSDDVPSVFDALVAEERDAVVREAAAAVLDVQDRTVVELRYVHSYPSEHIAELAGLEGPEQVRVVLQRAKRRLAKELERRLGASGQLGDG